MNDGLLKVNFASLHTAGDDIDRAVKQLEDQLSTLEANARSLVDTWDGAAKAAYAERQHKWTTASNDLKNILHDIKIAVRQSAQDYATTESNAEKRFR